MGEQLGADSDSIHGPIPWEICTPASLGMEPDTTQRHRKIGLDAGQILSTVISFISPYFLGLIRFLICDTLYQITDTKTRIAETIIIAPAWMLICRLLIHLRHLQECFCVRKCQFATHLQSKKTTVCGFPVLQCFAYFPPWKRPAPILAKKTFLANLRDKKIIVLRCPKFISIAHTRTKCKLNFASGSFLVASDIPFKTSANRCALFICVSIQPARTS